MQDVAEYGITRSDKPHDRTWPHAVIWLAVIAHVCMALAIWSTPKPPSYVDDHRAINAAIVLLAQANLLIVWLIVGDSLWLRRYAWAACGLSAIVFMLSTSERLQGIPVAPIFGILSITTTLLVAPVRVFGLHAAFSGGADPAEGNTSMERRQFSLLELFGASLGVAIAAALLVRLNFDDSFLPWNAAELFEIILYFFLPLGLSTLLSVLGLARPLWQVYQVILSGITMVLSLALVTDPHIEWAGMLLIGGSHWFLVAATLWIFQMCGYRLTRSQSAAVNAVG